MRVSSVSTAACACAENGLGFGVAGSGYLAVERSAIDSAGTVGLFLENGRGALRATLLDATPVGLQTSPAMELRASDDPAEAAGAAEVLVGSDVVFRDVTQRTGVGNLPLPTVQLAP